MSEEVRRDAVRAATARRTVKVELVPPRKAEVSYIVGDIVGGIAELLASSLVLMFCLGYLHLQFPQVPAAGYWSCVAAVFALSAVGTALRAGGKRWWER